MQFKQGKSRTCLVNPKGAYPFTIDYKSFPVLLRQQVVTISVGLRSRGTSGRLQPPNRTPGRVKNPSPRKLTPKQITTPSTGWGAQEQVFDYKTERMNNIKMMHLKNMISIGQYQKLVELVGEENENVCPLLDKYPLNLRR